jgi:hypothetical protein
MTEITALTSECFWGKETRGVLRYEVGAGEMATIFETEGWFCVNASDLNAITYRKIGGSRYRFVTYIDRVISFLPHD